MILVIADSDERFDSRAARWDLTPLPVPADVLVYTVAEWKGLVDRDDRFGRMLVEDTVWILDRGWDNG